MDADFAAETANMSRAQILQQAGTAMVAQANQLPQQVLSLLRADPRRRLGSPPRYSSSGGIVRISRTVGARTASV